MGSDSLLLRNWPFIIGTMHDTGRLGEKLLAYPARYCGEHSNGNHWPQKFYPQEG